MKEGTALLVDGDNVPPEILGPMLARLERDGPVTERRIFRNWRSSRNAAAWDEASKRYAFERVDRYRTSVGKNASDIALVVTAMDLLHGGTRSFCIASGDTDFAPLVERLRRAGARVVLIGHKDDGGILTDVADEYLDFRNLERAATGQHSRDAPARASPRQGTTPRQASVRQAGAGQGGGRQPASRQAAGRQVARSPSSRSPARPSASRGPEADARNAQPVRARKTATRATGPAIPAASTKARGRAPAQAALGRAAPAPSAAPGIDGLRNVLLDCYEVARTDGELDADGWVAVDRLGQIARSVDPGFSLGKYGLGNRASLSKVFTRVGGPFEVQAIGRSGNRQYRVRRRN